jgi:pyruvate/oxaloacetate carboxyltransferase
MMSTPASSSPEVTCGAHFHDARGLASANPVATLEAGITTFDASIGGLGGSPSAPGAKGNAANEDVVYLLTEMRIETGVDLEWLYNRQSGRRLQRPRRADELDGAGTGHAAHLDLPLDAVNEAIQDLNTGNL